MAMADLGDAAAGDEVRPYKIHVSTKYLNLTRQKLELTRLPHEGSSPKSEDWWEPKGEVESLIDYWLEKYSWRDQESHFNETLPQFRVAIPIPSSEAPLRLHFVHVRSPHGNALPLLAIPPFPFTSLSFAQLFKPLTDPEDASVNQPFHLVIPSLPGLAYSDPLPSNVSPIVTTAEMLNTLMSRLGYDHYLATNAGAASASPAAIDYRLARRLAVAYPAACLGTHLVAPLLTAPKAQEAPWEWAKWTVARLLNTGVLGYSGDDFAALKRTQAASPPASDSPPTPGVSEKGKGKEVDKKLTASAVIGAGSGLTSLSLREPNTLAYALCDSPTGLLVFVLNALRTLGPRATFTKAQIITFAQLAWVPGPEYALRFRAQCAAHSVDSEGASTGALAAKPRVAITVFTGESGSSENGTGGEASVELQSLPLLGEQAETYSCPAWANAHYRVLHTQRTAGKAGLIAWERPAVIAAGVRGLAKEVKRLDTRLVPPPTQPDLAPLKKVVIAGDDGKSPPPGPATKLPGHESAKAAEGSSSQEVTAAKASASEGKKPERKKDHDRMIEEKDEEEEVPRDEPTPDSVNESKGKEKGKEKELSPPPPLHDPLFSDSSPDTLVVNTPPLETSN